MKPRINKHLPEPGRTRPRDGMSQKHLDMIALLQCLGCGFKAFTASTVVPHHLMRTGEHGMGYKSSDKWAVPLCHSCHGPNVSGSLHDRADEDAWFAERNIDARAVARALWANTGDIAAMDRIVFRARQTAHWFAGKTKEQP